MYIVLHLKTYATLATKILVVMLETGDRCLHTYGQKQYSNAMAGRLIKYCSREISLFAITDKQYEIVSKRRSVENNTN